MAHTRAHRRLNIELHKTGRFQTPAASRVVGKLEARLHLRAENARRQSSWEVGHTYRKGLSHWMKWGVGFVLILGLLSVLLAIVAVIASVPLSNALDWDQGKTSLILWYTLIPILLVVASYKALLPCLRLYQYATSWQDPSVIKVWSDRMLAYPEWSNAIASWLICPRTHAEADRAERAWQAWIYEQEVQGFLGASAAKLDAARKGWQDQIQQLGNIQKTMLTQGALQEGLAHVTPAVSRPSARI
jgi:hypothetical protein